MSNLSVFKVIAMGLSLSMCEVTDAQAHGGKRIPCAHEVEIQLEPLLKEQKSRLKLGVTGYVSADLNNLLANLVALEALSSKIEALTSRKTSAGAIFKYVFRFPLDINSKQDEKPKHPHHSLGPGWRDPDGLLWFDALKENGVKIQLSYRDALAKCRILGARLPTVGEFLRLKTYFESGNSQVDWHLESLSDLEGVFWSSEGYESMPIKYAFDSDNCETLSSQHSDKFFIFCVSDAADNPESLDKRM